MRCPNTSGQRPLLAYIALVYFPRHTTTSAACLCVDFSTRTYRCDRYSVGLGLLSAESCISHKCSVRTQAVIAHSGLTLHLFTFCVTRPRLLRVYVTTFPLGLISVIGVQLAVHVSNTELVHIGKLLSILHKSFVVGFPGHLIPTWSVLQRLIDKPNSPRQCSTRRDAVARRKIAVHAHSPLSSGALCLLSAQTGDTAHRSLACLRSTAYTGLWPNGSPDTDDGCCRPLSLLHQDTRVTRASTTFMPHMENYLYLGFAVKITKVGLGGGTEKEKKKENENEKEKKKKKKEGEKKKEEEKGEKEKEKKKEKKTTMMKKKEEPRPPWQQSAVVEHVVN
ncbi:hypothetical protein J6590_023599 [Homalodisca vitripennis]|nr:hypothetical protein J6590_023599 [Homalodisca vitripennis]